MVTGGQPGHHLAVAARPGRRRAIEGEHAAQHPVRWWCSGQMSASSQAASAGALIRSEFRSRPARPHDLRQPGRRRGAGERTVAHWAAGTQFVLLYPYR